jgi:ribonuclease-3
MLPTFHNPSLLTEALTHRSAVNEAKGSVSNERLEFLGDAVLELSTTIFLYERLPDAPEGILTSFRSSLVKKSMLAKVATELGLGEELKMSHGEELMGGRKNPALLENTFEAFIGALFKDQGFNACHKFLQKHLFIHFDEISAKNLHRDHKSTLQEHIQSQGRPTPSYQTLESSGPDHSKTFTVAVKVGDERLGVGTGKSKQDASQMAAKDALEKIGQT